MLQVFDAPEALSSIGADSKEDLLSSQRDHSCIPCQEYRLTEGRKAASCGSRRLRKRTADIVLWGRENPSKVVASAKENSADGRTIAINGVGGKASVPRKIDVCT